MKYRKQQLGFILGLLLLLLISLKLLDWGVGGILNLFKHQPNLVQVDSTSFKYDTLFHSIDVGLEKHLMKKNPKLSQLEIKKMASKVNVSKPTNSKPVLNHSTLLSSIVSNKKEITFYLITKPGYIANSRGAVIYYLPGENGKFYYEISLKPGVYEYQTMYEPRDSVALAIDSKGAYKLGFQELHPYFIVYKDSL